MPRLAAVDVGSNTVHVLVADLGAGGRLEEVGHHVEMPELGAEVDRTGRLGERGEAAIDALQKVLQRAAELRFEHLVAGATAAVRRAADRRAFLARASAAIGQPVRLISEEREAQLSFLGVASRHAIPGVWLMGDLGGGSTELVAARGRQIQRWASLDVGSGRMAARHLSDPPLPGQRAALRAAATLLLESAPECRPERMVMTGGSATNLPILLGQRAAPALLTAADLAAATARLDRGSAADVGLGAGLTEGRVRALRAGVEILALLLERYRLQRVEVTPAGLRQGMLLAFLERAGDWWR